jgi:SAM-dependent methyltransferase
MQATADAEFCDLYPRFLQSTETVPSRARLNARWRAIFGWNKEILGGRRVVDLGCHDGRWTFAALEAGAAHVIGIEARAHLCAKALDNLRHYDVPPDRYDLLTGDAVETLRALAAGSADVVMCLGFFYHTLEHMRLLLEARRLGARYIIIDTSISPAAEPLIALQSEAVSDTRNAVDYGDTGHERVLVGQPSKSGLLAMLDYAGYRADFFDWSNNGVADWTDLPDYAARLRVTARATQRGGGA